MVEMLLTFWWFRHFLLQAIIFHIPDGNEAYIKCAKNVREIILLIFTKFSSHYTFDLLSALLSVNNYQRP